VAVKEEMADEEAHAKSVKMERQGSTSPPSNYTFKFDSFFSSKFTTAASASDRKPFLKFSVNAILAQAAQEGAAAEDDDDDEEMEAKRKTFADHLLEVKPFGESGAIFR